MAGGVVPRSGAPLGGYVHLPFCASRCPYCDYPVVEADPGPEHPYPRAVVGELERRAGEYAGRTLRSIYFGGGTPSHVPTEWIGGLVRAIEERWPDASPETTLESNPEDVDRSSLEAWSGAGLDRLVVGIQSFDDRVLDRLGRRHSAEQGVEALERASGFGDLAVGIDLIFGVPGQSMESWRSDLERIAAGPPIDGLYLYRHTSAGDGEDGAGTEAADAMFEAGRRVADEMGLRRTSVSSFETSAGRSRHNAGYWEGWEYLGLGMAAASLRIPKSEAGAVRRRNAGSLASYLAGSDDEAAATQLPPSAYLVDRVALAMRSARGLSVEELDDQFEDAGVDEELDRIRVFLDRLVEADRAERRGDRIRPTDEGLDVADAVDRRLRREVGA